jgi:hypothetical protein
MEINEIDVKKIHDLITEINNNSNRLEQNISNLNNLIHSITGEGIRSGAYKYFDLQYKN